MTERVNFKLAYNGQTYRFASTLRDDALFSAIKTHVASIVGEQKPEIYWKASEEATLIGSSFDLRVAIVAAKIEASEKKSTKPPCILLTAKHVIEKPSEAADDVDVIEKQKDVIVDDSSEKYDDVQKDVIFEVQKDVVDEVQKDVIFEDEAVKQLQSDIDSFSERLSLRKKEEKPADAEEDGKKEEQMEAQNGLKRAPLKLANLSFKRDEKNNSWYIHHEASVEQDQKEVAAIEELEKQKAAREMDTADVEEEGEKEEQTEVQSDIDSFSERLSLRKKEESAELDRKKDELKEVPNAPEQEEPTVMKLGNLTFKRRENSEKWDIVDSDGKTLDEDEDVADEDDDEDTEDDEDSNDDDDEDDEEDDVEEDEDEYEEDEEDDVEIEDIEDTEDEENEEEEVEDDDDSEAEAEEKREEMKEQKEVAAIDELDKQKAAREFDLDAREEALAEKEAALERRLAEFAVMIEDFEGKIKALDERVEKIDNGDEIETRLDAMEEKLEKMEEAIDEDEVVYL